MRIAIIGTAGRKEDGDKLNKEMYEKMIKVVQEQIAILIAENTNGLGPVDLVSGGAAWADHLSVSLYLMDVAESLTLYFPCEWDIDRCKYQENISTYNGVPRTANYYHQLFSNKMGENTLAGIQKAVDKGAVYYEVEGGFWSRNLSVGKVDAIIAYTFGEGDVPKDGGTKHTWDYSTAPIKVHRSIQRL